MSALISTVIPPQSFEIVRDRIGRILADEILNQFQISYNPDLRAKVWNERFIPFDKTETPAINVGVLEGSYDGQTVIQSDGTYKFYIDCYFSSKSDSNTSGDTRAMLKLQRLLGVCRAIIEDSRYKTLGFSTPPGFVMHRRITSMQIENPRQKEHDAESNVMGRLTLEVKLPEYPSPVTGVNWAMSNTQVSLQDSGKGYVWAIDNTGQNDYSFDH